MFGEVDDQLGLGHLAGSFSTFLAANYSLFRLDHNASRESSSGLDATQPTTMVLTNAMECICSDLQHDDYSPLYAWFNYIVIIIMLPSLSVFGVLTNIVNVFIYSRKRMMNSSNTYLLFLSCSDFMVILTGLFIFWIDSARSYIPELVRAPYTTVYTLPFGYMAQTCSIYFTVAAAFDCYVAVCWKRKSHLYCNTRRARQVVGTIVIASILYNSLRFPQFSLRKCFHDGNQELVIEICPTSLFFAINTIYNVYMYMVLMTLLPFLMLLVLNAFIVVKQSLDSSKRKKKLNFSKMMEGKNQCKSLLLKSADFPSIAGDNTYQKLERNSDFNNLSMKTTTFSKAASPQATSPPDKTSDCSSTDDKSSADDTITMIMVVVLFLSCNTLALIVNLIETFFEPDALLLNLLSDASNFLVVFNSSVNCVIYLIFNSEYREVFLIHFIQIKQYFRFHVFGRKMRMIQSSQQHQPTANILPTAERLLYRSPNRVGTSVINGKHVTGSLDEDGECSGERYYCSPLRNNRSPIWQPCNSPAWKSVEAAESELTNGFCSDEYISGDRQYRILLPESDTQFSFDPSNSEILLEMVDDDSGWDERSSTMVVSSSPVRPHNEKDSASVFSNFQTSYLAEVKINHSPNVHQPHIYVRPISNRHINSNNVTGSEKAQTASMGDLSITAL